MGKSKKSSGQHVHTDRFADKAAAAQQGRSALNKRWDRPQRDLDKANRGKALMGQALADTVQDDVCPGCGFAQWECDLLGDKVARHASGTLVDDPCPKTVAFLTEIFGDQDATPSCGCCGSSESTCSPSEAMGCFIAKMKIVSPVAASL